MVAILERMFSADRGQRCRLSIQFVNKPEKHNYLILKFQYLCFKNAIRVNLGGVEFYLIYLNRADRHAGAKKTLA